MIRPSRLALIAAAGLSFSVAAPTFAQAPAPISTTARPTPPPPWERDRVWTQTYSDLRPDPNVRFGVLPNGMRYAIVKNATPKNQASLRLRVGTGSLEETDAQQGLAHFLEHMAFDGSTHVPQGEMIRILERHGLAFGADTNASTDWTQTVYQLDLPRNDDDTLDTGLMLMREVGSELTLAPKAVDQERGVVLSEERARDTPGYRVFKNRLGFLLKDQLAAKRVPIGSVQVLQSPDAAQRIAAYYHAYYRPDRTTLIAVGDFDPDAMEAKIKARFSDWTASAPAGPEPDLGTVAKRGPETRVMVEPGGSLSIQIGWTAPHDITPDGAAKRRRDMIEHIGFAVLNRRMERLARSAQPPFISAGVDRDDAFRSARVANLSISAAPDQWRSALAAAEETRRSALQYGVRQDEVDREVTELRAAFQAAAEGASTRQTPRVAEELVESIDDAQVYTSPEQDLALFEDAVKDLTAQQVDLALRGAFTGQGPLVFVSTPKPIEGGEVAVAAAFKATETAKLAAPAAVTAKAWPYQSFGAPGAVADQREVVDLDTSFVRFANGVRLTVKPTKFRKDQILVSVRVGNGRLDLPKDRQSASWAAGFSFVQGGLKDISLEDMQQVLASKIYDVDLNIGDDAFVLNGQTRPQDLDTQMQVLAAYISAPGWRPEGFQRMRTIGLNMLRQMEATPQGVMRRDLGALLHPGDSRWVFPSQAEIESSKPDDVRNLLEGPLSKGPIEVVVVGDVTVERAIEAVGATLGALPPRPEPTPAPQAAREVRFPTPVAAPVERSHKGRADQSIAYMAWPTIDFFSDAQKARDLRLAELVLELRLIDQVRIAEGATYSPSANWDSSLVFPGYGYISAAVEIPPAKIAGFYDDVAKIAADLREHDVSPDELERARKPRIETLEKAQQTNEYWLGNLSGAQADPRRLDVIRAAIPGLERITAADIRRAAQTYLTDDRAWKLAIRPEVAQASTAGAPPAIPGAAGAATVSAR